MRTGKSVAWQVKCKRRIKKGEKEVEEHLAQEAQTSSSTFSKSIKSRNPGSDCVGLLGDQGW